MTAREVGEGDPIARFAATAQRYCTWAETTPRSADAEVETAIRLLLELMTRALELPESSSEGPDLDRPTHEAWKVVFRRFATIPVQHYATRDPADIDEKEHLIGDLHDDLADVWRDVRHGLDYYRAGDRAQASWQWRFTFRSHWGEHAAEALRVLVLTLHAR